VLGWVYAHQAHNRVSNINFDIGKQIAEGGGGLYKYPMNNSQRVGP